MAGKIDFQAGFSKAVADNAKVWEHDRASTVGASEVFGCLRHNYLKKNHPELAEEAEMDWGHTERGNLIENSFVVPSLHAMFGSENCLMMGADQKTIVDGRLSATPDGLVVGLERDALSAYGVDDIGEQGAIAVEIKSFGGEHAAPKRHKVVDENDPTVNHVRYEAKPRHVGQNIVQMGILRRKKNYQPEFGVVLYVNPVRLSDIRPAIVKYDDSIYTRAKARAESVFDPTKTAKDFPAEGRHGTECDYCPFYSACQGIEVARFPQNPVETKKLPPDIRERMAALARSVKSARDDFKTVEEKKKLLESELRDLMFDSGTNRAGEDDWSVSITKVNGKKSYDIARLQDEFGFDPEDYMKTGNPYFTMRVKTE